MQKSAQVNSANHWRCTAVSVLLYAQSVMTIVCIKAPSWFFNTFSESLLIFPASGYLNSGSGAFTNVGSNGYYWSCSPNNATNGYNLNFNSGNVNPSNNNNRAYGFPVRCVQAFTRLCVQTFY